MEIDELAKHARGFFTRKTFPAEPGRPARTILTLKDRHPTWVIDMVRSVHDDANWLPDDWKYEQIGETLDMLEEGADPDEPQLEADVYTSDLAEWLASHGQRPGYVDEAVKDFGHSDMGIVGDIMFGQVREKEEIWGVVVQKLRTRLEEIESGVEEEFESRTGRKSTFRDWTPREEG